MGTRGGGTGSLVLEVSVVQWCSPLLVAGLLLSDSHTPCSSLPESTGVRFLALTTKNLLNRTPSENSLLPTLYFSSPSGHHSQRVLSARRGSCPSSLQKAYQWFRS